MIKDLIVDVKRDLDGLDNLIRRNEVVNCTHIVDYNNHAKDTENRTKLNVLAATSFFITTVASALPTFGNINFSKHNKGITIESYQDSVDNQFQYLLSEYGKVFIGRAFTKDNFIEEILSLKSLNNNWDGYGAIPTEVKCASNAISLASKLPDSIVSNISEIFPNPTGTITIEWENNSHERLVAEIGNATF